MAFPILPKFNKDKDKKGFFGISDFTIGSKNFLERTLDDIRHCSPTQQLLIGTASGWVTGLTTMRIGKLASISIGGGILILLIANDKGYINIDWNKITVKADNVSTQFEKTVNRRTCKLMEKIRSFSQENPFIVTAFVGGFFIGLSC